MAWCGCHEFLIPRSFNVYFLTRFGHFRSASSSFSLSVAVSQIEEALHKTAISVENWSEQSFFQWFGRQFSVFAQAPCCRFYSSLHVCLTISPRHDSRRRSLLMWVLSHTVKKKGRLQNSSGSWIQSYTHSSVVQSEKKCFFRFFQKSFRITQFLDDNIGFWRKILGFYENIHAHEGYLVIDTRRSLSARHTVSVFSPITYGYFPQWVFVFRDKGIFSAPQSFNDWRLILLFHPISSKARKEQYLSYFVAKQLQIESTSHWQISYCHEA